MKKNGIIIFISFIGIPFLVFGQGIMTRDGWRPIREGDPGFIPRSQQQYPASQPYYPRPNVVTSPRPSQTSILPTQPPVIGAVGRKPILYSGPGCGICQQMMADFARNNPGKDINDYFEVIDDRSKFQPSIEGGPIGREGVASAMAAAVAAGPVRTEPIPQGRQPADFKVEVRRDKNGRPYDYYYLKGAFDTGSFPPNYSLKDPATGKTYSLPEVAALVAQGRLVFTVTYDPKTGEFATTHYKFQDPTSDGSKIVPNPKDVPAIDDDPMFDPPPKKAPKTMTAGEADKKIESLRKLLEQIQKDDAEKAKAGSASGSR